MEKPNNPEQPSFKKVSPEDWEKFKAIRLKALQTDAQAFGAAYDEEALRDEQAWREKLSETDRQIFVAEVANEFVATIGLRKLSDLAWTITAVYTDPSVRGRGLGQELMQQVIEQVRLTGGSTITLTVNTDQKEAVALYEKNGFIVTETLKDQKLGDGQLHDEYVMTLEL